MHNYNVLIVLMSLIIQSGYSMKNSIGDIETLTLNDNELLPHLRLKYQPSKERCGAFITSKSDRMQDEIWAGIISMIDGYKNIYWTNKGPYESRVLAKTATMLANAGIRDLHYCVKNRAESIILYNDKAREKALLLRNYNQENNSRINHYLLGTLLQYDIQDIHYFYQKLNIAHSLKADEKEAKLWKEQNKTLVEN